MNTASNTEITVPAIAKTPAAKWSYSSLIYSLFYFLEVIINIKRYSFVDLTLIACVYVLFLGLFIYITRVTGRAAVIGIVIMTITIALGASVNNGAGTLFGYGAFLASYYFGLRTTLALLAFNIAAQLLAAWQFDLLHPFFLGPSLGVTIGLSLFGKFSRKEFIHQSEQAAKNDQIEQLAAIAERERIARDMHDLLGHSLSSLALKAELAEKLLNKQRYEEAEQEVKAVAALARETLAEVRYAVTDIKQKGLENVLQKLAEQLRLLDFNCDLTINIPKLDAKTESTLIMISKEWVTNILRHSQGNNVHITLASAADTLKLTMIDNGHTDNLIAGNGIEGMQSRIAELGGTMHINTEKHVSLNVTLPLQQG